MSRLSLIDNSKTTHEVINGVHWWSNPMISVKINSLGEVYNAKKGNKLKGSGECGYGMYSFSIDSGGKLAHLTSTFKALFCYLVANVYSIQNTRLVKKDCSKGFTLDNVLIYKTGLGQIEDEILFSIDGDSQTTTEDLGETDILVEGVEETPKFYKVTKGETSYITEDGAKFPTKELAEWHQEKVTKGKSNAEIVLNYNGGYVMAEQLFLNEVVYNCSKPYEHFKDVMDNNDGVKEVVGESNYELYFGKCKVVVANNILRLNWDADFKCAKEEALIAEKLLATIDDKFMDMLKEINKFKALFPNLIKKDSI